MKFDEVLEAKILKSSSNDESRVVVAGVLQGDFTSENKRFYPMHVVKEAANSLVGKASMIGHESNSPKDIVARITGARMVENRLIADFKFGTDPTSNEMFTKVKEGLVDSYSIRAWGESKPGKVDGEDVEIVQSLEIATVDLVVEGGIKSAKVLRVYESAPKIETNKEEQMTEAEMLKKIEEAVAEATKKANEAKDVEIKALQEKEQKATEAAEKANLESHISTKLATVKDDGDRADIKETFSGKTKEDFDKHFERMVKALGRKVNGEIVIRPRGEKNESKDIKDPMEFLESSDVASEDKKEALKIVFA